MRPLDLGIFLPNAKGGAIMATGSPPQYFPTWELNRKNAVIAEQAGFQFLLSMVKWRGFGGETAHWDYSLESFTLMAACAAVTSRIQLYASVAIPTVHPAVIAKMTATIDDISKGRFGVNIVSGWNKMEYSQMGLWGGDDYFKRRYEYATEYLAILRALWREERVNYKSDFFSLEDCKSYPKPSREIPIICAGQSERGIRFTAEHADFGFLGGQFMAIPYVAGSYQTVANYLDGLAENGIAGVCFIFPDYKSDLELIVEKVLPLMKYRCALEAQLMTA